MPDLDSPRMLLPWRDIAPAAELAFARLCHPASAHRCCRLLWDSIIHYAWDSYGNEVERTRSCIRAVALLTLYLDWRVVIDQEELEDDFEAWSTAMRLNPISIGQLLGGEHDVSGRTSTAVKTLRR